MEAKTMTWPSLFREIEREVLSRHTPAEISKGEISEFDRALLWAEARQRLINLAAHVLRDFAANAREDIVQTVMLSLQDHNQIHRVASARYPRAYLARMLRNTATDDARATWSEVLMEDEELDACASSRGIYMQQATNEVQEQYDRLDRQIERLSPQERQWLHAKFFLNLTIREAAERFGVPLSTMASRYFRLTAKLRDMMNTDDGGA